MYFKIQVYINRFFFKLLTPYMSVFFLKLLFIVLHFLFKYLNDINICGDRNLEWLIPPPPFFLRRISFCFASCLQPTPHSDRGMLKGHEYLGAPYAAVPL